MFFSHILSGRNSNFWVIHPDYMQVTALGGLVNDIALVLVSKKFDFDGNVGPGQLPGPDDSLMVGQKCEAFGWGKPLEENDDIAEVLRRGILKVNKTSVRSLNNVIELESYRDSINLTTVGDSGGPVLCNEAVFAVVSMGESDKKAFLNGTADNTQATLILPNLGWIEKNINWRTPQQPIEQRASESPFTFVVLLLSKYTGEGEHHAKCHGAAVSTRWVIAPARCLRDMSRTKKLVSLEVMAPSEVKSLSADELIAGVNSERETKTWIVNEEAGVGLVLFQDGIENLQEVGRICRQNREIKNDLQLTHWQMKVDDHRVTQLFSGQLKVAQVSVDYSARIEDPDFKIEEPRKIISVKGRNGFAPAEGILHDDDGYVVGVSREAQSMWTDKQFIDVCTDSRWIGDVMEVKNLDGLRELIKKRSSAYTGRVDGLRKKRKASPGPGSKEPTRKTTKCGKSPKRKSRGSFGFVSAIMKWFV